MKNNGPNHWIGVVSRAHVQIGTQGGFVQLNHGKKAPLQRMHAGDGIVLYSPRTTYPGGQMLHHFTAIGFIETGTIYQVVMTPDFSPFRLDVRYMDSVETPIKPIIEQLSFIKDKTRWGGAFRFGHLKIPQEDFMTIALAMKTVM